MDLPKPVRVTPKEWALYQSKHGTGQASSLQVLGVDFETFYTSAYSVRRLGNWAYCHDERFDAWAVSVSDGKRTCVCRPDEFPWTTVSGCELVAHNADFDEAVFLRLREQGVIAAAVSPARWHCSAALCAFLQLPRDLAGAARAVFGVQIDKGARERAKGKHRGPDLFGYSEEEATYVATDAEMALALWRELSRYWPAHERRLCELTRAMGRTGLSVDWEYAEGNLAELTETVEALSNALPWSPALSIPKFKEACEAVGTPPPKSTSASDPWFQDWAQEQQRSEAVTWARHMQRIRSANRTAKVLESMRARRMKGVSGLAFAGATAGRSPDGDRMAYELKYFGATTGRWSGGGGLNMQNYNRKPAEGVDLRRCIRAPKGRVLAVVDYAQIESRVLLFLAGDIETLEMFRGNPDADAYEIHARATMGYAEPEPLREYCERTGSGIRQLAKARVLGLGFSCGAQRFVEVAKVMAGLEIGEEESERIVNEFRQSNPKVVSLWRSLNDACASCDGGDYYLPLPCTQVNPELGRYLIYRDVDADEDGIACTVAGDRIRVYGGLLAENWTQATARDVLASAWLRCDAAGYPPVLSVHDELVFEVPEASAEEDLRRIVGIMEEPMSWAPGLPLRADGKLRTEYGK